MDSVELIQMAKATRVLLDQRTLDPVVDKVLRNMLVMITSLQGQVDDLFDEGADE